MNAELLHAVDGFDLPHEYRVLLLDREELVSRLSDLDYVIGVRWRR